MFLGFLRSELISLSFQEQILLFLIIIRRMLSSIRSRQVRSTDVDIFVLMSVAMVNVTSLD